MALNAGIVQLVCCSVPAAAVDGKKSSTVEIPFDQKSKLSAFMKSRSRPKIYPSLAFSTKSFSIDGVTYFQLGGESSQ